MHIMRHSDGLPPEPPTGITNKIKLTLRPLLDAAQRKKLSDRICDDGAPPLILAPVVCGVQDVFLTYKKI